jgi:hypothetical protein
MTISKYALTVGAGLLALSFAVPASAAPVLSNTAAVKSATDAQVTEVRWRSGAAVAAGVGAGIIAGAAIANSNNYYYSDPYYAPAYGPSYYSVEPDYGYYGYTYSGPSHRWYNGRRDTNASGNW